LLIKEVQIGLLVHQDQFRSKQIETLVSIDESMQGHEDKKEYLEQKYGDQ
jgi:hypothetical protein